MLSRCPFLPRGSVPGADYISQLHHWLHKPERFCLPAQEPLPETMGDLRRMVWEQRTATVVMMTRLEEGSGKAVQVPAGVGEVGKILSSGTPSCPCGKDALQGTCQNLSVLRLSRVPAAGVPGMWCVPQTPVEFPAVLICCPRCCHFQEC